MKENAVPEEDYNLCPRQSRGILRASHAGNLGGNFDPNFKKQDSVNARQAGIVGRVVSGIQWQVKALAEEFGSKQLFHSSAAMAKELQEIGADVEKAVRLFPVGVAPV